MEKFRLKKITFEIPPLYIVEQLEANREKEIKNLKKQLEQLKKQNGK